jgi:hypothetical protein
VPGNSGSTAVTNAFQTVTQCAETHKSKGVIYQLQYIKMDIVAISFFFYISEMSSLLATVWALVCPFGRENNTLPKTEKSRDLCRGLEADYFSSSMWSDVSQWQILGEGMRAIRIFYTSNWRFQISYKKQNKIWLQAYHNNETERADVVNCCTV